MPIGKYFWPRTFLSNEWIVSRNVSIAIQSEDFPEIAVQILRCIAISETVRDGHQKCAGPAKKTFGRRSAAGQPFPDCCGISLCRRSSWRRQISPERRPGDSALGYLR